MNTTNQKNEQRKSRFDDNDRKSFASGARRTNIKYQNSTRGQRELLSRLSMSFGFEITICFESTKLVLYV
jgi:hypothetical protein